MKASPRRMLHWALDTGLDWGPSPWKNLGLVIAEIVNVSGGSAINSLHCISHLAGRS